VRGYLVGSAIAAILVIVAAHLGVSERLGAHPYWAVRIAYLGVAAGTFVAAIASIWPARPARPAIRLTIAIVLLLAAAGVAVTGKARFAASFAEDVVAGRMWFFGWIGVAAMLFTVLFLVVRMIGGRR
jgi:hypothetical protein